MESAEVLIVGGGPAGSTCAWKLRQAGASVILIDKAQFPRHKVCAGWITPPIVDELKLDVTDFSARHVLQPITRFLTGLINGTEVETDYRQTVSYGIRRCEFDDYLLRRSGAHLVMGEPFKAIRHDGSDWVINDRFRAPIVVGAGGHFCPIARHFESKRAADAAVAARSQLPVVLAQEVEFEMTDAQLTECRIEADRPELFFCPDLKGYGWVFRKGNYLNVGLGREGEEHLSSHVSEFVEFLRQRGKVTFDLPGKFQGHAYRLRTQPPATPNDAGIVLIGDAIGLADRQSGEGIRPSIESGLLCAASILEVRARRSDQVHDLYQAMLHKHFGDGRTSSSALSPWIPKSVREFAAHRLMSSRWFTRRVLLDQWFLHRQQPPLDDHHLLMTSRRAAAC